MELVEIWRSLPREERRVLVVLFSSVVLGSISLGVGIYHADYLLAGMGALTILISVTFVVLVGFGIVALLVWILWFLLTLPFRAVGWIRSRKPSGDEGTEEAAEDKLSHFGLESKKEDENVTEEASGCWDRALFLAYICWLALVGFQLYILVFQYLE